MSRLPESPAGQVGLHAPLVQMRRRLVLLGQRYCVLLQNRISEQTHTIFRADLAGRQVQNIASPTEPRQAFHNTGG